MESEFERVQQMLDSDAAEPTDYQAVLEELEKIEAKRPLPPNMLVLKGMCIQVASGQPAMSAIDAEAAFHAALEIDKDCFDAYVELGSLYSTLEGDAERAMLCFQHAVEISRAHLAEATQAAAVCLAQTKSPQEAEELVRHISENAIDEEKAREIVDRIGEVAGVGVAG